MTSRSTLRHGCPLLGLPIVLYGLTRSDYANTTTETCLGTHNTAHGFGVKGERKIRVTARAILSLLDYTASSPLGSQLERKSTFKPAPSG